MKIALILGEYSVGHRPLNFKSYNIWQGTRGLTGTDLTAVMTSIELAKKHDVSLFTVHEDPNDKPSKWEGVHLYTTNEIFTVIDDSFDVVISINEPDLFRSLSDKPLRICWSTLNDFGYCPPNFEKYVDKWLGVCDKHMNHLKNQINTPTDWD